MAYALLFAVTAVSIAAVGAVALPLVAVCGVLTGGALVAREFRRR